MSQQSQIPDVDSVETQEWLEALEAVIEAEGVDRAHFLLEQMIDKARRSGARGSGAGNSGARRGRGRR